MEELRASIRTKKAELDRLLSRMPERLTNLDHASDLELTYTSNAIEGNTLTAAETTIVIEQGITVAGKPLKDHLEAIDHYDGFDGPRLAFSLGANDQLANAAAHPLHTRTGMPGDTTNRDGHPRIAQARRVALTPRYRGELR